MAVPQTIYGTPDQVPEAGVLESWLPKHQQYAAEFRFPAVELHSQATDVCILLVTKPAYLSSGKTGPKDRPSGGI